MMPTTPTPIQAYAEAHTTAASPLLARIYQETQAHVPLPQMCSGHLQGRILAAMSRMLRPSTILEIGTYTGYATLCLAEGLQPDGTLHTIDKNVDLAPRVKAYFEQSGQGHQIQYHLGKAIEVIPHINATYDLVFIDADKKHYGVYYDLVLDRLRSGGFIMVDNVLWKGKVLATSSISDPWTQAIVAFNKKVHQDPRVENVLLPIRDGLMVLQKK